MLVSGVVGVFNGVVGVFESVGVVGGGVVVGVFGSVRGCRVGKITLVTTS